MRPAAAARRIVTRRWPSSPGCATDNFTFLGMREYVYSGKGADAKVERDRGAGLGILSNPDVLVLRQGRTPSPPHRKSWPSSMGRIS